jgi:hypothetical protein
MYSLSKQEKGATYWMCPINLEGRRTNSLGGLKGLTKMNLLN